LIVGKKKKKKDKKNKGMLATAVNAVTGAMADPAGTAKSAAKTVTGGSATVGALELAALAAGLTALLSARGDKGEPSILSKLHDIVDDRIRQVMGDEKPKAKRAATAAKSPARTRKTAGKKASKSAATPASAS
jgi:hypothetical protein